MSVNTLKSDGSLNLVSGRVADAYSKAVVDEKIDAVTDEIANIESRISGSAIAVNYSGSNTFTTGVRTAIKTVTLPKGHYIFTGFMWVDTAPTNRLFLLTSEQTNATPIAGINPSAKMGAISSFFNITADKDVAIQIYVETTLTTNLYINGYFVKIPS